MKRILICDDIEDMVELLKIVLEPEGYTVETANSAASAISKIRQNTPDLLVSNVMMPDMSGYELANYIKTNLNIKNLPILFVTAALESEFKQESLNKISQVMFKPLDINEFVDKIKFMLRENL